MPMFDVVHRVHYKGRSAIDSTSLVVEADDWKHAARMVWQRRKLIKIEYIYRCEPNRCWLMYIKWPYPQAITWDADQRASCDYHVDALQAAWRGCRLYAKGAVKPLWPLVIPKSHRRIE